MSLEVLLFFLREVGQRMDLGWTVGVGGIWEEWREGKLQLGCMVWEKNK